MPLIVVNKNTSIRDKFPTEQASGSFVDGPHTNQEVLSLALPRSGNWEISLLANASSADGLNLKQNSNVVYSPKLAVSGNLHIIVVTANTGDIISVGTTATSADTSVYVDVIARQIAG